MVKIKKLNRNKTYTYPNGKLATPEVVLNDFPAIAHFQFIIETDESEQVLLGLYNLNVIRSQMGIDSSLSEDEAIAKIEEIKNTPAPEPEPDSTERIAAALELQNLMAMPDAE